MWAQNRKMRAARPQMSQPSNFLFSKPILYDMPPRYLDSRVKWVWFIPTIVALGILWFVVCTSIFIFSSDDFVFGMSKTLFSIVFLVALFSFVGVPVYLYNHIEFMSFTFELAEHEFIIRQGVLTRHTTVIPYNRIQNVNTARTLLERLLGLATLQIETAGSNPSMSEGILPGVSRKDELIHEIMQKVERIKKARISSDGSVKSEQEMLGQILKELVALNSKLSNSHSQSHRLGPGKKNQGESHD